MKWAALFLALMTIAWPLAHAADAPSGAHTLKAGETLAQVAETYYGNRAYQLVIAKLNKLDASKQPAPGAVLQVPELQEMLVSEGLPRNAVAPIAEVLKARYNFLRIHEDLDRALHPTNGAPRQTVPASVRDQLKASAKQLEKAGKALAKAGNYSDSATRMRQRCVGAADLMRKMANNLTGSSLANAEYQVHLLFAQTFVRGLMWAHNDDGDQKMGPAP